MRAEPRRRGAASRFAHRATRLQHASRNAQDALQWSPGGQYEADRGIRAKFKFRLRTNRTSFAPETTLPKRNERDRERPKRWKINKPYLYPAAHNGLVAGSSPAGPTSLRSQ